MNILSHKEAETFFKNTLEYIARTCIELAEGCEEVCDIAFNWNNNNLKIVLKWNDKSDDVIEIDEGDLIDKIYSDFNEKTGQDLDEYYIEISIN